MPLTNLHPDTEHSGYAPTKTLLESVDQCRAYLYIGGLLSEAENRKVKERMVKWCKKFLGTKPTKENK